MTRRILALILLGLALIVCVALAASESLTNRTGRTATAVTVTFSEQVRITSYDEAVFPTKEPSTRSDSFRFSSGQLENGARFSVSWTPSTAEITGTEWETTGSSAAVASAGSSTPLTYEQIMAQIAHYPGPDEPLYVPAEGEQIWLTDLEGHADIYDNDSIKINSAPGFDKNQITKIEVYRNGVKMRFLPALFDVLTNAQMKTFDGNPEEHTPKSSHTDHAIWGYEYAFRVYTSGASSPVGIRTATVQSPVRAVGRTYMALQVPSNMLYRYDDETVLAAFRRWREEGVAGLQFDVTYFMDSIYSTTLFAQYDYNTAILPSWARTATPDEIRHWIRLCREAGLEAEIRICVWMTNEAGGWRGEIMPRSWDSWFTDYTKICVATGELAQQEGCAVLTPLVELDSCMRRTAQVKRLLAEISGVFSGRICISQGTSIYLANQVPLSASYGEWAAYCEDVFGTFWDWVGPSGPPEIGIEWWGEPQRNLETQADQRLSVLLTSFLTLNNRLVEYFRSRYPQCQVRFCEMGAYNADGSALPGFSWSASPNGTVLDYQEFADCWAALLLGSAQLGTEVTAWTRHVVFDQSWLTPGQWFLDGTPALRIICAFLD